MRASASTGARALPAVVVAAPEPRPTPPPAAVTTPPDLTIVSVTSLAVPAHFALDGDVTEWGSLLPPPPPPPRVPPPPMEPYPGEEAPDPPAPNPRDAESHVAIAMSASGAMIAADLRGLVNPVSYEPWAELRSRVFEAMLTRGGLGPTGLSYQPGDPLHVESIAYDAGLGASRVSASEETLYTRNAAVGDVEVGLVSAYNEWIAILKKGKLVDIVDLPGRLMGVFERDRGIHVLSYSQYTSETGFETATWSAITVAADGSHNEGALEQEPFSRPWNEVSDFHSKTLDSFGVRGWANLNADRKDEGVELLWRWSRAKKAYVMKKRAIPVQKGLKPTP